MIDIPKKISKEEYINRIEKNLKVSREEAEEIYKYDQAIDDDTDISSGTLSPDKEEIARKMCHTGTRKKPMVLNLPKKQRKPNATKGGLVSELAQLLKENSDFEVTQLQIPNAEQKISFNIGGTWYTWTLTAHRKKPTWIKGDGDN